MSKITRTGVDLAKRVLQVHAVYASALRITSPALNRDKLLPWCAQLPPGCFLAIARLAVQCAQAQWAELDAHMAWSGDADRTSLPHAP